MKAFVKKLKNIYLLSFCIPVVLMLGIFVVRGIYPFGRNSFMFSDMYHQYIPFLTEFWHKLHEGGSLAFSWHAGLGSDFTAIYAYYLASPLNWLAYLVPEAHLIEFMTYLIVCKIGLCGFSFSYYLSHHYKTKDFRIIGFSVLYAMSGFLAAYNWNHMWMDVLWLAPLVIFGLEELIVEGKCRRYCLLLALSILSNYYLSIMLCIFLVLWFLVQLFTNGLSLKRKAAAAGRFALCSLLGGGMAGALLFPVRYAMHATDFLEVSFPSKAEFYFNGLEMLARHVPMLQTERGLDHWPNIYCGVLAFVLVPVYFFHKQIPLRQKLAKLFLLVFFLLSFSVNILNFLWHGLNYPNSLPARQSFLYIFVVLTLCFEAVYRNQENGRLHRLLGGIAGLLLLAACGLFVHTDGLTVWVMASAWIFLAGYAALALLFDERVRLWLLYCRRKRGKKKGRTLSYSGIGKLRGFGCGAILLLVCVEAAMNMGYTSVSPVQRPYYLNRKNAYAELAAMTGEAESGFWRMDNLDQMTKNDSMLGQYASASIFSSTVNGDVRALYEMLGMGGSKVSYYYRGATPFTAALFGVQYLMSDSPGEDANLYERIGESGDRYLYRCRYALPVGFMISAERKEGWEAVLEQKLSNPLVTQNDLAEELGISERLFETVGADESKASGNTVTVEVGEAGHFYAYVIGKPEGELTLTRNGREQTLEEAADGIALDLGYFEAGESFCVKSGEAEQLVLRIYRLSVDTLKQITGELGSRPFEAVQTAAGLEGTVTASEDGYLLLSVPAEKGWQVLVDGEETVAETFADALIAVPLTAGSHRVELTYETRGVGAGLLCTAVSAGLFLLLFGRRKTAGKASETGQNKSSTSATEPDKSSTSATEPDEKDRDTESEHMGEEG